MDTRKIAVVVTVAVIALIAVGIGYAYTATTVNSGNDTGSEFIELNQTGAGAYKFADGITVVYNTENTAYDTYTYKLTDVSSGTILNDYILVKLGNQFTISAKQYNSEVAETARTCVMTVTDDKITVESGWVVIFKVDNNNTTTWFKASKVSNELVWQKSIDGSTFSNCDSKEFTINVNPGTVANDPSDDTYYDTTVDVYYGYAKTSGADAGVSTRPVEKPLDGVSLTFTVTVDKPNVIADTSAQVILAGENVSFQYKVGTAATFTDYTAPFVVKKDSQVTIKAVAADNYSVTKVGNQDYNSEGNSFEITGNITITATTTANNP